MRIKAARLTVPSHSNTKLPSKGLTCIGLSVGCDGGCNALPEGVVVVKGDGLGQALSPPSSTAAFSR